MNWIRRFEERWPAIGLSLVWRAGKPLLVGAGGLALTLAGLLVYRMLTDVPMPWRLVFAVPIAAVLFGFALAALALGRDWWVSNRFPIDVRVPAVAYGPEPWGVHQQLTVKLQRVRITNRWRDRRASLEVRVLLYSPEQRHMIEGAPDNDPRIEIEPQAFKEIEELRFTGIAMLNIPGGPVFGGAADDWRVFLLVRDYLSGYVKRLHPAEYAPF